MFVGKEGFVKVKVVVVVIYDIIGVIFCVFGIIEGFKKFYNIRCYFNVYWVVFILVVVIGYEIFNIDWVGEDSGIGISSDG